MFSLRIQNFQSIVDVTIPFEGFCCIVGKSNLGKSALVRAFRAWAYNDVVPGAVRNGADCFILTGTFSEPKETPSGVKSIKFIKGPKINTYSVEFHNGRIMDYPKIGKDVPIELKNLGFQILTTENEEKFNLHVQSQHDALFLVCSTETTLTGVLNKLFDLSRYEKALRSLQTDILATNRQYDEKGKALQSLAIAWETAQKNAEITEDNLRRLKTLECEAKEHEKKIKHYELGVAQHQRLAELDSGLLPMEADIYVFGQDKEKVSPLTPAIGVVSRLVEYANHMKLQEFNASAVKTVSNVLRKEHASVVPISKVMADLLRAAYAVEASRDAEKNLQVIRGSLDALPKPDELPKLSKTLTEIFLAQNRLSVFKAVQSTAEANLVTISDTLKLQKDAAAHKETLEKEVPRCPTCLQPIVRHPQAFCISKH